LLGVGLLGGFTTFSAVAVDTVRLSEQSLALGLGTAAANVGLGIAAAALGLAGGARLGARRGPAAPGGRA
ncbi:CrcB family protein, partial [Leucobacter sp. M11]|uniref:CrcB family protein n=1 Tax=Leucobacter sp. M11 TaxID=2993565 RepID=UPI002D80CC2C